MTRTTVQDLVTYYVSFPKEQIDRIVYSEQGRSEYEKQRHQLHQREVKVLYDDLEQVIRFVAFYGGYVGETLTVERFRMCLDCLSLRCLDDAEHGGQRKPY